MYVCVKLLVTVTIEGPTAAADPRSNSDSRYHQTMGMCGCDIKCNPGTRPSVLTGHGRLVMAEGGQFRAAKKVASEINFVRKNESSQDRNVSALFLIPDKCACTDDRSEVWRQGR